MAQTETAASATLTASCADLVALLDHIWTTTNLTATVAFDAATAATLTQRVVQRLVERLRLTSEASSTLTLAAVADEALSLNDGIWLTANLLATSGFDLASTSTQHMTAVLIAAELLRVASGSSSTVGLAARLAERLAVQEVIHSVYAMTATEIATLADVLTAAITARFTAPESLALADRITFGLTVIVPETLGFDDDLTPSLTLLLRASETLAFIGRLDLPEGSFSAWVMNAETTGTTSYSNFPFNSLFTHQGKTYGVAEDGLYEMTGNTDDGEPIEAMVRTGDIGFGTSREKNIPRAYLNVLTDGRLILKTISSVRGARTERIYELAAKGGNDEALRRVPLARGLRGVTWAFEIRNVDGSDFDFADAEVIPVVLSRRGS
jgi:hypothetical protein